MDQLDWREEATEKLKTNFQENNDIIALSIFGSTSNKKNKSDFWSDVDGLLVVKDEAYDKYSTNLNWIKFFGEIYAYQYNSDENTKTFRLVFEDFRKLDLIIIKQSAVNSMIQPNASPYWKDINVLFSKSDEIEQKIKNSKKEISEGCFDEQQFKDLVNNFWFIASSALYKTFRNDLLIAQHLSLDLFKDCLLLGMILRDRETGTNIHKTGGIGNDIAKDMNICLENITQFNIINLIDSCGKEFDQLCIRWNKDFLSKYPVLSQYIQKARFELQE